MGTQEKMATMAMTNMFASDQLAAVGGLRPGEVTTGTTIMAVEYDGGVLIGADSRTTTGAYIANRVTDKLTKVTDHIYCCRSGSAADTQAIANYVKANLEMLEIELGRPATVKEAAMAFRQYCYTYRDRLMA